MKRWEWNCQFDSRPLKVWNLPNLFVWRWCATYRWKILKKDYNFVSNLISIGGLTKSYGPPKLLESQFGKKWHLSASFMARHKEYYKGEGGGCPKSMLWWVLWVHVCPWLVNAPKALQLCINQLVIWFVQVCVSNWLTCHSS